MKPFITSIATLFAAAILFTSVSPASAQAPMKMKGSASTARAHNSTAARGANPNIKRDEMKANPASAKAGGSAKSKASRGSGNLHFDNHTNLYVRCYVDGDYVGTMGPSGDLYDYEVGLHTMFCTAVFDDGSSLTWGPDLVDAPYHLSITP